MISAKKSKNLRDVTAVDLTIAVSGLLLSWVPILGVIISVLSIILLMPVVVQSIRHSKLPSSASKFIISIIVACLAFFIALPVTINVLTPDTTITYSSNQVDESQLSEEERKANFEAQQKAQVETEKLAAEERAAKQTKIDNAAFIDERSLALIVKDPDAHIGEIFKVWGEVAQFDSATGVDTFRAYISSVRQEYWATNGENVILTGDEAALSDFIRDDIFVATVEVESSTTYDNVMGGGNTVPTLTVHNIEHR